MTNVFQIVFAVLAAGATFFLVAYGLEQVRSRVGQVVANEERRRTREDAGSRNVLRLVFLSWARHLGPRLPGKLRTDLQRNIVMAGGLQGLTPAQLVLYGGLAALVGLALGALSVLATGWPAMVVLAFTVGGALLPFIWLRDQVKSRHQEILSALPYHLDLLTLSVEAGLDFTAGVAKMVEKGQPGALREEFNSFLGELRIGKTRAEAMESMSERVGLPALSSFLSALIQADRMGSGLGRTLRQQAEQLRSERFQRAEKLAGEAPVKMLIPLVLFIFPTIFIILGAPLVFQWIFR